MEEDHEFILLACDGIWDVLSNQEVVSFVRRRIAQKMQPEEVPKYFNVCVCVCVCGCVCVSVCVWVWV